MDSVFPPHHRDSLILAALVKEDTTAWSFFSVDASQEVCCSVAALELWNLPRTTDEKRSFGCCSRSAIARAMTLQGVDTEEFLTGLSSVCCGQHISTMLIRRDLHKVQVEVTGVADGDQLVGHLVRYTEPADPSFLGSLMNEITAAQRQLEVLSPREREVLHFVYEGRTNKSISIATGISEKTVEKHRARIMQKLGINCTAQLFRLVSKAWLLSDVLRIPASHTHVANHGPSLSRNLRPPLSYGDT